MNSEEVGKARRGPSEWKKVLWYSLTTAFVAERLLHPPCRDESERVDGVRKP